MTDDDSLDEYVIPPARVFLACPHDLERAKLFDVLLAVGWNSVLCLATGDMNILPSLRHAREIYFVVSECIHATPFVDMVLKVIEITKDSDCKLLLLRLDETEIPPILSALNPMPEDTQLFSYVTKRIDYE